MKQHQQTADTGTGSRTAAGISPARRPASCYSRAVCAAGVKQIDSHVMQCKTPSSSCPYGCKTLSGTGMRKKGVRDMAKINKSWVTHAWLFVRLLVPEGEMCRQDTSSVRATLAAVSSRMRLPERLRLPGLVGLSCSGPSCSRHNISLFRNRAGKGS